MRTLNLKLGCGLYDRTLALYHREVKPRGITIKFHPMYPPELFLEMFRTRKFDISELSLSSYIMQRLEGYEYIGIPVFTVRRFRHSFIFANSSSGIEEPSDLIGKRMGVYNYEITAAVWARGILQHEYGVHPASMTWVTSHEERVPFKSQPGLKIQVIEGANLTGMLTNGKLDALITPIVSNELLNSASVKRLFPDYKEVEKEYYSRTKIFPIMHMIVVREKILQRSRWVARSLLEAFRESKKRWYEYLFDARWQTNQLFFAWPMHVIHEERQVLGEDPYPYNIRDNKDAIETLMQYQHEQGLIEEIPGLEALFEQTTFDDDGK